MCTRIVGRNLLAGSVLCAVVIFAIRGCSSGGGSNTNQNGISNGNANANANVNENTSGGGDGGPAAGGREAERLHPADINYDGAFRLPDEFNWGALGMSFYPAGDGGNGSLLVTGFELIHELGQAGMGCPSEEADCYAHFGEVTIPTPVTGANWEDLPVATVITPLTPFDGGLASTVNPYYVWTSDIEYVPQRGSQTSDKLYGSINVWYAEGAFGSDTFPTVWFADMDGTDAQGMFHVGPQEAPYHGRKTGAYLFAVPQWYADDYLGGRTLMTGRARGTPVDGAEPVDIAGGSQGPTLFAIQPFDTDSASGDLDALPVLYYRVAFPGCAGPNVGNDDACDYPTYTMCDDWTGAAFVDNGSERAIMMLGHVGLGDNCYDEPPVECNDPCSDSHGYHCQPYERQVIFYDVYELAYSAGGGQDPWVVLPYETWRPGEFYLYGNENICTNAGGMTFDAGGQRIFMVERGLGGVDTNAIVVHVFSL